MTMRRRHYTEEENKPTTNCHQVIGSTNNSLLIDREFHVTQVLFTMNWRLMTQILLALPVVGLFICLITSLIFHADHINDTFCEVYNFLPSISAVTGVSPQRYLWRICVALHISPRLLVAVVARQFYASLATRVTVIHRPAFKALVTFSFVLNLIELSTLCGVTYISNKENYPVHEKLFMVFMMASLIYMVCVVRLLKTVEHTLSPVQLRSLSHKKWLLGTKISATTGLLFFFWRHRVYCIPKAFSWFSLCEYVIATCNMLYHVSVSLDFSDEHLIVGHIVDHDYGSPPESVKIPNSLRSSSDYLNTRNTLLTRQNHQLGTEEETTKINSGYDSEHDPSAVEKKPSEGLQLVSSSFYCRLSGSSSSPRTSPDSPTTSDNNINFSSRSFSRSSSTSSESSPDSTSPSEIAGLCDSSSSGSIRQVLGTIHENPENGTSLVNCKLGEVPNAKFTEQCAHKVESNSVKIGRNDLRHLKRRAVSVITNDPLAKELASFQSSFRDTTQVE